MRSVSRPVHTAFVAFDDGGQLRLERADRLELLAHPGQRTPDRGRVDVDLALLERRDRQQPGQPHRRLEVGDVRRLRIHDHVDVVPHQGERRDAGRRVERRPDGDGDGRAAVLARLAQLLAHRPLRHRAVLGLEHDPHVGAARDATVERQDEVALLGAEQRPGLGPGPVQQVAAAPGEVAEHRRGAAPRSRRPSPRSEPARPRAPATTPRSRRAARGGPEALGDLLAELVERRVRGGSGPAAARPCSGRRRSTGRAARRCGRSPSPGASRRTAR